MINLLLNCILIQFNIVYLPDSNTYIKCYCRNVSEMVEPYKEEADEYFRKALKQKYFNNENLILIEINYVTQGFFMLYEL